MKDLEQIREALKEAEEKGKLSIVAAVVGVDEKYLRDIMNGEVKLNIIDRIKLSANMD